MQTIKLLQTRILWAFMTSAIVVLALAGLTWRLADSAAQADERVAHTLQVLNRLSEARSRTLQIELSTQSYRISGQQNFVAERDKAVAERERLLSELGQLTADNPRQIELLATLRKAIEARRQLSDRVVQLRATEGAAAANAFVAASNIAGTRAAVHGVLLEMVAEEQRLLTLRQLEQARLRRQAELLSLLLAGLLPLLLAGVYVALRRQMRVLESRRLALVRSEQGLATTLSSIGDAVLGTDEQGLISQMNPAAEALTGWRADDALGRRLREVCTLEDPAQGQAITEPSHGLPLHILCTPDGRRVPVSLTETPLVEPGGARVGRVVVLHDQSLALRAQELARQRYEELDRMVVERTQQLHASEQHLRALIDSAPAQIAFVGKDRRYVYANSQYQTLFAPQWPGLAGRSVAEVLGPVRLAQISPMIERVLAGEPVNFDWEPIPGVWLNVICAPSWDANGDLSGYYALSADISDRRKAEEALRASRSQLERVLEGSDQGYWEWDLKTRQFLVSARWESLLGYAPGELRLGASPNWAQLVHPDDLPAVRQSVARHLRGETESHEVELRARTRDGGWRWILTRGRIVARDEQGTPLLMSGTHTDIHERKALELAMREAHVVFESSGEAIMVTNAEGAIVKVNPAFERITGYPSDEVLGRTPRLLRSGRHDDAFFRQFWDALLNRGAWRGEIWNRRKDGQLFPVLQSVSTVRDPQGRISHFVSVSTDISDTKAHEAELNHVANYDSLTDLPNRRLLSDRLAQAIHRAARSSLSTAVCFLDLDNFKAINDAHGHAAGDALLVGVSGHLKAVLRSEDTLARLGGDEFVVLLSDLHSLEECTQVLERILHAARRPIEFRGLALTTSVSVGVSLYPADNSDPDTLLRHADQAMYLAKQAGRNRYQLFDPESDRLSQQHREQVARVRQGLRDGEFVLYYQPKVNFLSGKVVGVEGLARWQHPQRGLLPPAEFLAIVGAGELEQQFGEWVIEAGLRQLDAWRERGLRLPVSVNISANHLLRRDFAGSLERALARHPSVPARDLELEVLETAAIHDIDEALVVLARCQRLGVRFALDDFGTGYSSLTHLRKLPVETLKIDQSFVRDMLVDPDDLSIVKGVIDLAAAFKRRVIAEGVETVAHGLALRDLGCHVVQGYGIARPMPAEDLHAWLARWAEDRPWEHRDTAMGEFGPPLRR
ncbi:EAL domain-containing protein [Pelomonas sp. CA6]|uniref:EAL domain-containing protein n=1 Tax=Pelomonas sp. CA6 TaxID=2907999 RepID=UPI001F4B7687|nr:EAL domain-containing protein [Pelomonas sp. CA6]MCH7341784.1 EAL domain-containing protein [Pelomonas sp. CA6]